MRGFGPHGGFGGFGGPHGGFGGPRFGGPMMMGPGFGPRGMMFGGPYYGGYRHRRLYGTGCCTIFWDWYINRSNNKLCMDMIYGL